jgi:hypothetical protein
MSRRTLSLVVVAAVSGALAAPALSAPPKGFKKSFTYQDATADVTASAVSGQACDGMIAAFAEPPIQVTVPAKGTLKVVLDNVGDWALDVRDSKGRILSGSDGGTPEAKEAVTVKLKAAGKYLIYPCNVGGAPTSAGTYEYKP